jgi:predicted regulator of Ras-like GTPase activity (Roadblock/LC7/MglB family)
MRKLWDSSEIQEAAVLFKDLLKDFAITEPALLTEKYIDTDEKLSTHANRSDLLKEALVSMCRRGNFTGSLLADNNGLPVAIYNSPVDSDALAAFTSILGRSLEETGRLFNQSDTNIISIDINYIDKVALRKFLVNDEPFFLMIISPQELDVRAELELCINYISAILKGK